MLDEVRRHDAIPTAEERDWIDSNPVAFAVRFAVFLVLAVSIGGYLSLSDDAGSTPHTVAKAEK
jgi:hypothetical protein